MAKDFLGWSKWSPHVGNAITIATGIPVVSGIAAGVWAYLAPSYGLGVALVALAALMMTLWCCIGFLWLRERSKPAGPIQTAPVRDCAWGLDIGDISLNYDPGSAQNEWQFRLVFVNGLPWPIRIYIDDIKLTVDNQSPSFGPFPPDGVIIRRNTAIGMGIADFPKGALAHREAMMGSMSIDVRYGHPDTGYSRTSRRVFDIECQVRGTFPPFPHPYPVARVPVKETDDPLLTNPPAAHAQVPGPPASPGRT